MMQQTPQEITRDNEVYKVVSGLSLTFGTVLKGSFYVIRKMAAMALTGFHVLVESAGHKDLPRHAYWWDSPESVDRIFRS